MWSFQGAVDCRLPWLSYVGGRRLSSEEERVQVRLTREEERVADEEDDDRAYQGCVDVPVSEEGLQLLVELLK